MRQLQLRFLNLFYFNSSDAMRRVYILLLVLATFYSILILKLFSVAVFSNQRIENSSFISKKVALSGNSNKRFSIYDRNNSLVAVSLDTTSVYANTKNVIDPKVTAKKLKSALPGLNYKSLLEKLESGKSFIWIKRNVTPQEHQKINDLGVVGVYFQTEEKRAYPYSSLLSHILGYVGLDGYGLSGVERFFDESAQYKNNIKDLESVNLSIDIRVQNIMKEELSKAMKEFDAKGATGIIQDVQTGEIVSLVSLPDYSPYSPHAATEEQLFNKASLGNYEVGSIFKVFSIAMALDAGVAKPNDVYDVDTPIQMAGYSIKDFYGKKGWLSLPELLMYSSNIGVSQVALELGREKQVSYLKQFGFFENLNIELLEKTKPLQPRFEKWKDLDVVSASYGYSISTSPLHLVRAMGAVVNGGMLCPMTILKKNGEENYQCKRVLKESTSETMRKMLRMVVKHGVGKKAEVDGYFIGGKTGTSNKPVNGVYRSDLRLSSFLSAFPMNNPRYVMLISVDEPKGQKHTLGFATGGWVAAPAAANVVKRVAPLLGVFPDKANQPDIDQSLHMDYNPRQVAS